MSLVERLSRAPGAAARPAAPVVPPSGGRRFKLRATLLVIAVYAALLLLIDPSAQIGSDASAKITALEAMRRSGSTDPTIEYWMAGADPAGAWFPLANAGRVGDRWSTVVTLPMIELARPLYNAGGVRAAMLLPMLGGLLCAYAAAALARRLGHDERLSFLAIALASPVAVYSLSLWEHTLGLAAMAWAVVVLVDIRRQRRAPWWAAASGVLFGAAATMRTEALVFGAVFTAVLGLAAARERRRVSIAAIVAAGSGIGLALPLYLNQLIEQAVFGAGIRAGRAASTVTEGGSPAARLRDGSVGFLALLDDDSAGALLMSGLVMAAFGLAVLWWTDETRAALARRIALAATALYAVTFLSGWRFVPGLLPTMPVAVGAVAALRARSLARDLVIACACTVPVVWATQYTTNVIPQWSGRYVLLAGFVLTVVGLGGATPRAMQRLLVGIGAAVTLFGLGWMITRTHSVADFFDEVAAEQADVVISREPSILREAGADAAQARWLSVNRDDKLFAAVAALPDDARNLLVIRMPDQETVALDCYAKQGEREVGFLLGFDFTFTRYSRVC